MFQFSNAQLGGRLIENIFLFLHDLKSDNILRLLKSSEDLCLKERDVIEIVLSCKLNSSCLQIFVVNLMIAKSYSLYIPLLSILIPIYNVVKLSSYTFLQP